MNAQKPKTEPLKHDWTKCDCMAGQVGYGLYNKCVTCGFLFRATPDRPDCVPGFTGRSAEVIVVLKSLDRDELAL